MNEKYQMIIAVSQSGFAVFIDVSTSTYSVVSQKQIHNSIHNVMCFNTLNELLIVSDRKLMLQCYKLSPEYEYDAPTCGSINTQGKKLVDVGIASFGSLGD